MLGKNPDKIKLSDIFLAVNESFFIVDCCDNPTLCNDHYTCFLKDIFSEATKSFKEVYLNNLKHDHTNSSYLRSSDKLMPFYFIIPCILPKFYTRMGLSIQFLPSNDKTLPPLYVLDLLSRIFFILIILILST